MLIAPKESFPWFIWFEVLLDKSYRLIWKEPRETSLIWSTQCHKPLDGDWIRERQRGFAFSPKFLELESCSGLVLSSVGGKQHGGSVCGLLLYLSDICSNSMQLPLASCEIGSDISIAVESWQTQFYSEGWLSGSHGNYTEEAKSDFIAGKG